MTRVVPLAVIGCGAISESYYFPALATMKALKDQVWLVEPDRDRRAQAAARWGFDPAKSVDSIDDIPTNVRGAINATPSHLHLPTTTALVARGIGVLVEKPLAENATDAQALVDAADGRCVLTVNHFRRLWPSYKAVAQALQSGAVGTVTRVDWAEGRKFEWPVRTGFMFRRQWTGRPRGALLDMGVHALDTICWWMGERPSVTRCVMDGVGGPEAFVSAELATGSAKIGVTISFLAKLGNQYLIEGTAGAIRGATSDYSRFEMRSGDGKWKTVATKDPADRVAIARLIIENFTAAIEGASPVLIPAASAVQPLLVIDELYEKAADLVPDCYREWMPAAA